MLQRAPRGARQPTEHEPERIDEMTTFTTAERDRPAYGAMFAVADIMRANRESGGHYFDADTMRFFGSRVLPTVYAGRLFVTSERRGFDDSTRAYSVREFMPDGTIETVGEFGAYASSAAAKTAARRAARERHAYYFDGRHGRGGRERVYVVTASDPWEAMGELRADFRVRFCGRAKDYMTAETSPHYVRVP